MKVLKTGLGLIGLGYLLSSPLTWVLVSIVVKMPILVVASMIKNDS